MAGERADRRGTFVKRTRVAFVVRRSGDGGFAASQEMFPRVVRRERIEAVGDELVAAHGCHHDAVCGQVEVLVRAHHVPDLRRAVEEGVSRYASTALSARHGGWPRVQALAAVWAEQLSHDYALGGKLLRPFLVVGQACEPHVEVVAERAAASCACRSFLPERRRWRCLRGCDAFPDVVEVVRQQLGEFVEWRHGRSVTYDKQQGHFAWVEESQVDLHDGAQERFA
mmetsp:Transcript_14710/g.36828  ORF Transcript_14710/g.36828 Transcript_14710/m.36828 type:complete len:226 (-) Transcript_14710:481-1158(-)